jgi:UDP:flavonoid glycosyltransferase YjiC (YdhE family)
LLQALSTCAVALSGAAPPGWEHPRLWPAPLLDLTALLPHADLLICHGGAMTVQAALAAGVPTLAIPDNADAALCAVALIQSGAGTAFSPGDLRADPALAGRALRWLLDDPRFRQRAQSLAPAMDPAGALRLAVERALGL